MCPSKFPLLWRAFVRCALEGSSWHVARGGRKRGEEITWRRAAVLNQREGKPDGQVQGFFGEEWTGHRQHKIIAQN